MVKLSFFFKFYFLNYYILNKNESKWSSFISWNKLITRINVVLRTLLLKERALRVLIRLRDWLEVLVRSVLLLRVLLLRVLLLRVLRELWRVLHRSELLRVLLSHRVLVVLKVIILNWNSENDIRFRNLINKILFRKLLIFKPSNFLLWFTSLCWVILSILNPSSDCTYHQSTKLLQITSPLKG